MRKKNENIKKISLNLPVNQINFLDNYAAGNGMDRTSVIRGLIANFANQMNYLYTQGQNYQPIQSTTLNSENINGQGGNNAQNNVHKYLSVDNNGRPYRPQNHVNPMKENAEQINPMQENHKPVNPMYVYYEQNDPTDSQD